LYQCLKRRNLKDLPEEVPRYRRKIGPGRRRLWLALLFCASLMLGTSAPAHAFWDVFGLFSPDADEEEVSPDAHPYVVGVQVAGDDADLEERLRAASQLYSQRDQVPPSTAALIARARGDYARILAALFADGRYGGSISISIEGRLPENIPPDAELPRPAAVNVTVDPGPVFAFGDVSIHGRAPLVPGRNDHIEPPEELGLFSGARARSRVVLRSEDALIDQWRSLSHAKARIADRQVVAEHPTRSVDVAIAVDPGPPAVYGPVEVTGTEHMNPDFVRRQSALRRSEAFDPADIELAQEQLRRLQVFQSVRIVEGDEIGPDGELPITINVVERPLRIFGVGGAVSSVDGGEVEAYWQHRNLFGQAERLRVEGRVSGIGTGSMESLDAYNYFAATSFEKPGVITPFTDLTAGISARLENLDTYRDRTAQARIGLAHRFSRELRGEVAANVERSRIEDPLGQRDFLLTSVPARIVYDTRDDEMDASEGLRAVLKGEPFHEFEFGNSGLISELQGSAYQAFDADGRFVLAGRVAIGSIAGAPRAELPASRLFFAGGGGTIRGYPYRSVGPRLRSGQVVGGRSYFAASAELRARVTDQIGIVPFVDVGSAFDSTFPDFSEEMQVGAGLGLRYYTPLGPIRFDVAVPVNRRPGDPSAAFYVGIGQSF
jgi:translocation and assembly module TamA